MEPPVPSQGLQPEGRGWRDVPALGPAVVQYLRDGGWEEVGLPEPADGRAGKPEAQVPREFARPLGEGDVELRVCIPHPVPSPPAVPAPAPRRSTALPSIQMSAVYPQQGRNGREKYVAGPRAVQWWPSSTPEDVVRRLEDTLKQVRRDGEVAVAERCEDCGAPTFRAKQLQPRRWGKKDDGRRCAEICWEPRARQDAEAYESLYHGPRRVRLSEREAP